MRQKYNKYHKYHKYHKYQPIEQEYVGKLQYKHTIDKLSLLTSFSEA